MPTAYASHRMLGLAVVYALAGWAAFTVLLVAAGDVVLPASTSSAAPPVVALLAAGTGVAVAALALDFFRRAGRHDAAAGLVLGTALAGIGLALDGALLLATGLHYPGVDASRRDTLAAALLLGYAAATAVPAFVATLRSRRGS